MKTLTKKGFINLMMEEESVKIDKGNLQYKVIRVNDETISDMVPMLKEQLIAEGKYNNWVGIFHREENETITMDQIPVYGDPDKFVTKWLMDSKEDAIKNDLSDRSLKLLKRANTYRESQN